MKKIIAFIMAALLLLTACNNSQGNLPKSDGHIESNIETTDITQAPKASKEIIITVDNWGDYFEITEYPVWKENAFGEVDDLAIWWGISLKEEYGPYIDTEKEQSVAFELSGKYSYYGIEVDIESQTYSYTEPLFQDYEESVKSTDTYGYKNDTYDFGFLRVWSAGVAEDDWDGEIIETIYRYYDISVLRAQGKIYLLEQ